jgi:hypothetical protein
MRRGTDILPEYCGREARAGWSFDVRVSMRCTRSLLTPAIFHGALEIAIYLVFLSYVS